MILAWMSSKPETEGACNSLRRTAGKLQVGSQSRKPPAFWTCPYSGHNFLLLLDPKLTEIWQTWWRILNHPFPYQEVKDLPWQNVMDIWGVVPQGRRLTPSCVWRVHVRVHSIICLWMHSWWAWQGCWKTADNICMAAKFLQEMIVPERTKMAA